MAIYDCGERATVIITHPNRIADRLYINGKRTFLRSDVALTFECYSTIEVSCDTNADYTVDIIPLPGQGYFNDVFLLSLAGLLAGALFAYVLNRYAV